MLRAAHKSHHRSTRRRLLAAGLALGVATTLAAAPGALASQAPQPKGITKFKHGIRGIDMGPNGSLLVSKANGTYGLVARRGTDRGQFRRLGKVPRSFLAPAVDHHAGRIYVLSLPSGSEGGATLYRWTKDEGQVAVANVGRYQRRMDPDPYDLEDRPKESNPYGVAALPGGGALVADAANNDVLKVTDDGTITTVARVKPSTVRVPRGLGEEAPPAGTMMPAEAVITSVAVGTDGYYYIGELTGFPAPRGASKIWRIAPDAEGAVCDPATPKAGPCKKYVGGLTSIVALEAGPHGAIYAVSLAKMSWLKAELSPNPFDTRGAVIRIAHDKSIRTELGRNQLVLPGDVAVDARGRAYVTTPIFGASRVLRID